ncbi:hypothetical protein Dsin_018693 [Dipteronia sinensis]|uniref:Transcription factor TCP2-like n=1 Tax=Dipteronia sinensis TaxID=43782 RepID=A0AAE0A5S2_9ROSI|nr:hypothetical protein Dsin_018693 [Dipteronia sinensis]
MEVEEIQTQACKFPRISNGRLDSTKVAHKDQYPDDEEDHRDQQLKRGAGSITVGGDNRVVVGGGANRLRGWHSSRIIRVSRASGGKDRHSKVWTSKGLRDRRVRLSVTTAIQFYDLQDRLGYDQPSKAVEWLIKAAADSISELPSLNSPFPDTPKQLSDEKRASEGTDQQGFDSVELDGDPYNQHNQSSHNHLSLTKSACSSTSETSKGSGLSLSRSEQRVNRVKARERARVRVKEKEKDNESSRGVANTNEHNHHHHHCHHQNVNHISQSSSFTELLTGGIGSVNNNNSNNNNATSPNGSSPHQQNPNEEPNNFFQKARPSWPAATAAPMEYFSTGLLGPSTSRPHHHFTGQIQLGSSSNSLPQTISIPPPFSEHHHHHHHHQEMQPFSFVPDHLIPVATSSQQQGDYNLNFTISSGLAGFNRGTLQSNSSSTSLLPHNNIQRPFGSNIDGSNLPFFIAQPPSVENHHHHHQFPAGFDGRLHLYHGDGSSRHSSDQKGKGKN